MRSMLLRLVGAGLACFAHAAFGAWQTLGSVVQITPGADILELTTAHGARLQLSFVSADVVRVRMTSAPAFERDFSYAVQASVPPRIVLQISNDKDRIVLRPATGQGARIMVQLRPELLITILDARGRVVISDDPTRPMAFDADSGAVQVSKTRIATELYYGFGEKALPMSRDQQYMTMWNSDTPGYGAGLDPIYQSIPFFIALRGGDSYGLFFDNTYRSSFDMGKTDPARYVIDATGGELNYYVFTGGPGRKPANVLAAYTQLTGRGPLPPLWALGYQQSRYSYVPDAQVRDIAKSFRDKNIPADVLYFDIGYMQDYRIFTWSRTDFPQPEKLLADLHADGFHTVTIVDPGIKLDDAYPIYNDGRQRDVFTHTAAGEELHATVWPGVCAFPDFTNPKARAWFGSLYKNFLDQGVDGFWNDMNEPATFLARDSGKPALTHDPGKTFPLDARHDGDGLAGDHARYHNVYGMQMARATFEGLVQLRPQQRPFVLTRAGYAGVQRYSAVWTGDNASTWEHLALSIPMLANLSISGVPFVGADVGGFTGAPDGELYARWLQAAVLTPFLRTHSAIDTPMREPWSYGKEFEDINRATIQLRYRLLPYLYTLFADSEATGMPPMRPLWFEYSSDVSTYLIDDEFLLGKDVLVAPVVHEAQRHRTVYFPKGDAWVDWWNGTLHVGGSSADIATPIERLPLFLRAGASIATQPVVQNTDAMKHTPLTILVALGAGGSGHVYQDTGDGYAYRQGESRSAKITLQGDHWRIEAPQSSRYARIGFVEFVGLDKVPAAVLANGEKVGDVQFDPVARRLRVALPDSSVVEITLQR